MPVPRKRKAKSPPESAKSPLPPLIILCGFLLVALTEAGTHFIETAAGAYLNWRNADREAWGTLWEKDTQTREATRQLEEETTEAARLRHEAEAVGSFADLAALIPENSGVPLSPEKTVQLFRDMPASLQPYLIDPSRLTELFWSGEWKRSAAWRRGEGSVIYLIDDRNRIITEIPLTVDILNAAAECGRIQAGGLNTLSRFAGRLFPAERFLNEFYKAPEDLRHKLVNPPELLLSLAKPLTQVGLSPADSTSGIGRVGFESETDSGAVTVVYPADSAAVKEFLRKLTKTELDTLTKKPAIGSPERRGGSL